IRKTRKKLGLTQQAFADHLGVSYATVNRWEQGHARPQPDRLQRLNGLIVALRNGKILEERRPSTPPSKVPSSRHRVPKVVKLDSGAILNFAKEVVALLTALDGSDPRFEVRV